MKTAVLEKRSYTNGQIRLVFVITIGLSAFLLFLIQPMFSKMVLPLLGGSSIVWNTAMVFFQSLLLLGYLYAHFLVRSVSHNWQVGIHVGVCLVAFLFLPFAIAEWFPTPTGDYAPFLLFGLFLVSIGLPFFAIAANAPLIQSWFSRTPHPNSHNPYFLYSASNIGSALALIAYPFVVEPGLTLPGQAWLWAFGFFALVFLLIEIGLRFSGHSTLSTRSGIKDSGQALQSATVSWQRKARWVLLAFVPAAMMLGVTNLITLDLVSVPLFWIAPLLLYLVTFVIAFSDHPSRPTAAKLQPWAHLVAPVCLVIAVLPKSGVVLMAASIIILLGGFFLITLYLHTRLSESRPSASGLTGFYVLQSLGGVLGGASISLIAPLVFSTASEILWLLILSAALSVPASQFVGMRKVANQFGVLILMIVLTAGYFQISDQNVVAVERSYFGVHKIMREETEEGIPVTKLAHGTTLHGAQLMDGVHDFVPQTYYVPQSGVGLTLANADDQARVGVIGLGAGSLSCYAKPDQSWTYFEIDPTVIRLAQDTRYFRFIEQCKPETEFVLGDARISLQHTDNHAFDYLVVDAFSSDSIPVHLLTTEAIALYYQKLATDGVLLMHLSNRYFELAPIIARNAASLGHDVFKFMYDAKADNEKQPMATPSVWVAIAKNGDEAFEAGSVQWEKLAVDRDVSAWTDNYSDILATLKLSGK